MRKNCSRGSLRNRAVHMLCLVPFEPRHEKPCLRGFRLGKAQTSLRSYRNKLESWNLGYSSIAIILCRCEQQRRWSDCADAQADLRLCCSHMTKTGFLMTWLISWCFYFYPIWAWSWENLLMPYATNKGADQPAHPRSLISTFVVHCLDSIISLVSMSEISRL